MNMKRLILSLVLVLGLAACTTPGGAGSNPTQGANQPAVTAAQTVGHDQAAVPSTANAGQGVVNNRFASESDATVRLELLKLAAEQNWSAEQIAQAFAAASSAPQNVTITGSQNASGGNASAIGSGTGGGAGVGGPGTIQRP
jgi:hypothetical protein